MTLYQKISHSLETKHHTIWVYLRSILSMMRHAISTQDFPVMYYKDLRLVQFSIPKTACSTTTSLILQKMNIGFNEQDYHSIHTQIVQFFITEKELQEVRKDPQNFAFSFVRNPYTRLISCYRDKIQKEQDVDFINDFFGVFDKDMSFEEFARTVCAIPDFWANIHFKPQHTFILLKGSPPPDFIGKFENYANDIAVLQEKFDLPAVTQSFNVTSKGYNLSQWYTPELAQKVYARYQTDFEEFGYSKEIN